MPDQPPRPLPRGFRTLAEAKERAGPPGPRVRPVIVGREPSAIPGWDDVTVSLYPGEHVVIKLRTGDESEETVQHALAVAVATYAPAGRRLDLYREE
jgi:hypothetical protein